MNVPARPIVGSGEGQVAMLELAVRERSEALAGRAGDARAAAFRRSLERALPDAYRLAAVILGDRIEAEDAVHDAAVAAWRASGSLRDAERFDAWFGRIVVNGCRDRLRRVHRRRLVDLGREPVEGEHPPAPDELGRAADRDAVERALEELAADERIVVVLRYHLDLTVPAIAARVGVPEGTVKSRLHHALRRLRAALEEDPR